MPAPLCLRLPIDYAWAQQYASRDVSWSFFPQNHNKKDTMSTASSNPVTELLMRWRCGDQEALQALLPLVYDELRRIAHHHLQAERAGHTLQSIALVHEAFLRLVVQEPLRLDNRAHFFAVASQLSSRDVP